jgi:hypothetical protein
MRITMAKQTRQPKNAHQVYYVIFNIRFSALNKQRVMSIRWNLTDHITINPPPPLPYHYKSWDTNIPGSPNYEKKAKIT